MSGALPETNRQGNAAVAQAHCNRKAGRAAREMQIDQGKVRRIHLGRCDSAVEVAYRRHHL